MHQTRSRLLVQLRYLRSQASLYNASSLRPLAGFQRRQVRGVGEMKEVQAAPDLQTMGLVRYKYWVGAWPLFPSFPFRCEATHSHAGNVLKNQKKCFSEWRPVN